MPAADVEQRFQPFEWLGANRRGRAGGLGLGLSIVQAIADAHSATIDVRPQLEGGLHIDLSFPAADTSAVEHATGTNPQPHSVPGRPAPPAVMAPTARHENGPATATPS